ncbi:MAG TPA: DUF423 domain-containing protein [Verrucomicrobiales bacterium]|jgi:uncharacterized membrane protein YgdD (TMEM256/DUF423 family)|nr:DUF423 domain-containing protein [Verrucomicrobiales bacterium]
MTSRLAFRISAALGFVAVALGAFGAHGLEEVLRRHDRVDTWETAVLYHFVHVLMMALLAAREPFARGPWVIFLAGIVIFSGSLYVLSLTNLRWLGAITPLGGVTFLVGWGWLAVAGVKREP